MKMKRLTWIRITVVLCVLAGGAYVGIETVLGWPSSPKTFRIGTCVEDPQLHRVFEITGNASRAVSGTPARVVRVGNVAPDRLQVGQSVMILDRAPAMVHVDCPLPTS